MKTKGEFTNEDRMSVEINYKANKLLVCGIGPDEYNMIIVCQNSI